MLASLREPKKHCELIKREVTVPSKSRLVVFFSFVVVASNSSWIGPHSAPLRPRFCAKARCNDTESTSVAFSSADRVRDVRSWRAGVEIELQTIPILMPSELAASGGRRQLALSLPFGASLAFLNFPVLVAARRALSPDRKWREKEENAIKWIAKTYLMLLGP